MKKILLLILPFLFSIATTFGCGCAREKVSLAAIIEKEFAHSDLIICGLLVQTTFIYTFNTYQASALAIL